MQLLAYKAQRSRAFLTVIVASTLFAGCGDLAGEKPKIEGAEPTPTPAVEALPAETPVHAEITPELDNAVVETTTAPTPVTTPLAEPTTTPVAAATGPVPDVIGVPVADSSSPYLRAAAESPVRWQSWSPEVFRVAQAHNRPILIDIGATWSHKSRLMNDTAYADEQAAKALNEGFISIKVDADERPDLWHRYKTAYELINRRPAEPPLTIFAMPDGRPVDIVGAVGPAEADGVAGLTEMAAQLGQMHITDQAAMKAQADTIEQAAATLLSGSVADGSADGSAFADLLTKTVDDENAAAKIMAGRTALYLLHYYSDTSDRGALNTASELLLDRFRSGQRDHVMGGYFTRSTADGSIMFGKTLCMQGEMLRANACAFAAGGKAMHKEAAQEVLRFCRDWLEAPEGGFYSNQSADYAAGDDAAYFTWTRAEIDAIVNNSKEAQVFAYYLNVPDDSPVRTNLHVTKRLQAAADSAGVSYADAQKALDSVRLKLRDARMAQELVPPVNKSLLAGWNGDMICSYLDAWMYLGDDKARDFALRTADTIINKMVSEKEGVARVLNRDQASGFGFSEDNVKLAAGLVRCFEASGQIEYLESARSLMDFVEAKFLDAPSGLYRDTLASEPNAPGMLRLTSLPVEDERGPSVNASAAMVWYQLFQATSDQKCLDRSNRMADALVKRRPLDSPALSGAGRAFLTARNNPPRVLIIGDPKSDETEKIRSAALDVFRMGKLVEVMSPVDAEKTDYRPSADGSPLVYVCTGGNCAPPTSDVAKVKELAQSFGRGKPTSNQPKGGQ